MNARTAGLCALLCASPWFHEMITYAQPSQPRNAVWRGTNGTLVLVVEESSPSGGRDPVLSGVLHDGAWSAPLLQPVFTYRDNTFRAEFLRNGVREKLEIVYLEQKEGVCLARWSGHTVGFHQK